jgi:hypothetical protein
LRRVPAFRYGAECVALAMLLGPSRIAHGAASTPPKADANPSSTAPPRDSDESFVWASAESVIVVDDWPRGGQARVVSGAGPFDLAEGRLLFVPVERGDWVEVGALAPSQPVQLGYADGRNSVPDTIVWEAPGTTRLRVPSWSSASHVAIRSAGSARLVVSLSAHAASPLQWFLWDGAVSNWARHGSELPEMKLASARRIVSALGSLREALTETERADVAPVLLSLWLEESLRTRPLLMPFLKPTTVQAELTPTVMVGPSRVIRRDPTADVHRWQLRAKGPARVIIRENGAIAHVVNWPERSPNTEQWSTTKSIRTVASATDSVAELEVVFGTIAYSEQGYSYRPEYRELFGAPRRQRGVLLAESSPIRGAWQKRALASSQSAPAGREQAVGDVRLQAASAFEAFSLYEASKRADSRDTAVVDAMLGLVRARDSAWQALFAQRLLDLAVDDDSAAQRQLHRQQVVAVREGVETPLLDQDAILRRALRESLTPPRLAQRPAWGERVEAWTSALPSDPLALRIATKYWEAFPYRSIAPRPGTPTTAGLTPLDRRGACNPAQENIEAWLVPDQDTTELSLDLEQGVYAVATLRPLDATPQPEGLLQIDDVPITIHATAGLSSRVALGKGQHRILRSALTPRFALETTDGMLVPCRNLFRWQRWTTLQADSEAEFDLPSPGSTSVVGLRFDAKESAASVAVALGPRKFEVTTRPPATGVAEIGVAAKDDSLGISSAQRLSVSVAMRRELDPQLAPVSVQLPSLHKPSGPSPQPSASALSPTLLAELRELGARLRSIPDSPGKTELRHRRALLLIRAGFTSLALRDLESLPSAEEQNDLLRIDGVTASAIPIGLVSTIGPLPTPIDQRQLIARRQAWQQSGAAACALDLDRPDVSTPDAETLLAAHCAEQSGLSAAAGRLFEQIARSTRHATAMLHAATLVADSALASADKRQSLNAALLEAWASAWGADSSALRARLSNAINWVTPMVLDGAAGVTWLAHGLAETPTARAQLLANLTAAPAGALLVEAGETAELLVTRQASEPLLVTSSCDTAIADAACQLVASVDSNETPCRMTGSGVACTVEVPGGKHRIRLAWRGSGAIGWMSTHFGKQPLTPVVATQWSVLDGGSAAHLTIRGPTVLHLRARASGAEGESIALHGCEIDGTYATLALPTGTDRQVRPWPQATAITPVGQQLDQSIPIPLDRSCQLTIAAHQPQTLLRLSFARADGLPTPRRLPPDPTVATAASPDSSPRGAVPTTNSVVPVRVSERQPLLVGARFRFVSESLSTLAQTDSSSEGAFQDVFGEASASVDRELVTNRWWGSLQAGARMRSGPTTEFARIAVDLPPQIGLPGVDLIGTVYSQALGDTRTTTYSTTGRLSKIWRPSPDVGILPQIAFTTLHLGTVPPPLSGVDGDVYSHFYATHPRYASGAATLALRPFVDSMLNLSLSARSLPLLDGLDRAAVTAELLTIPVSSWPLLGGVDWMSSYRPSSSLRSAAFIRHDFGVAWGLWHWITPSERIRWFGRVDLFFDAPSAKLGGIIVAPTIGLEITSSGSRGLRDLSPQQAPMKEFQERGSARVRTGRVGELGETLASGAAP